MTKEDIGGFFKRTVVPVDVPGWDKPAHVRSWSGSDLGEWEDAIATHRAKDGSVSVGPLRVVCVGISLCDEQGNRLVPEKETAWLGDNVSQEAMRALFDAASKLNRVLSSEEAVKVAEGN